MVKCKFFVVLCLLVGMILCVGGCWSQEGATVGEDAEVEGVVYTTEGQLTDRVRATPPAGAEAVKQAFKDLDITITAERIKPDEAVLEGRNASNDAVKVTIDSRSADASKMWIRVGFSGDEAKSMAIYNRVKAHLPE